MRSLIFVVSFIVSIGSFAQSKDTIAIKFANTITVEELKQDLTVLSSDAMEGRETGERGQKMAAAFIKSHFEDLGLVGPVSNSVDPYYQNVELITSKPGDIYVKYDDKKLINLEDCFYYGAAYNIDEFSSELIFAGSGTEADFEGLDIAGKSVLIQTTNRNDRQKALEIVQENGGDMLFVIYAINEIEYEGFAKRVKSYLDRETMGLDKGELEQEAGIIFVSPTIGSEMFGRTFEEMQQAIADKEAGKKKAFKKFKPQEISFKVNYDSRKINSENVLGYLEGSEFKDEVIVMTAHYDHEGIKNGEIYNGADDDGSGTVAIMEMAEAFVTAKNEGHGPRRSILFMTVTAEEKGLLGSEYYADNPIFPLENTVVNLNMDMIGRIGDEFKDKGEYIRLIGSNALSTELHNINEMTNQLYINLYLDYRHNDKDHPERFYYRSDHWNFAKNGIPIISYGNGPHADYHKPTDTVDKIQFELLRKRAQLIFHTAWEVANRDNRIVIDKEEN